MYSIEVIFEAIFNFYNENKNKNKQKMKYEKEKSKIAKWKNEDQTSQISDKSTSRLNEKRYMYTFFVCKYFFLAFENRKKKELLKEKQHKRRGAKTYNFGHA